MLNSSMRFDSSITVVKKTRPNLEIQQIFRVNYSMPLITRSYFVDSQVLQSDEPIYIRSRYISLDGIRFSAVASTVSINN